MQITIIDTATGQTVTREATAEEAAEFPAAAAPTPDDVAAERARRILAGLTITVPGHATPVRLTGDQQTRDNLQALAMAAQMRVAAGDTTTPTTWRDADNADHVLTPPQLLALWSAAAAYVGAVYAASWALKDATPIPADYADNTHWPAAG